MSRSFILIIILLVVIIGGLIYLSRVNSEVTPTHMEQDVTNEALAH
jgi:hypothetical protein